MSAADESGTQPDQAEGERDDGQKPGQQGDGQGVSAPAPAEGGDDAPGGGGGAPRG